MDDLKIVTTLNLNPAPAACTTYSTIIRGASAELIFDFNKYSYLLASSDSAWDQYIEQITFLFKWDQAECPVAYQLHPYKNGHYLFDEFGNYLIDKHFTYDEDLKCLSFIFDSCETAQMANASADYPVQFEVAIKVNMSGLTEIENLTESQIDELTLNNSVIIEKQNPLVVVDSLFRESGLYTQNCGVK